MKRKFEKQIKDLSSQSQKSFAQLTEVKGAEGQTIQSLT